ncbi:MAG: glucosaminidase domain-containing protein [Thermogemmatispora sp.]|jgi:hypothetical protein|uniref:Uncharacterized protein n=1 Tax=Thermogemmatispora aurantia TaxID=2045279 RepID=A0A5J4K7T1_9CHLR|nr:MULTISPECIES: glucosaminidase domain-containing protein [Thermogemmatispora]MBE3565132.1 glucosaminidase domain-containing protein [Thermogemmatispora sp.]GER82759.1 hypothetical protein KTAU_13960 [Thermogemmatispora aurantia]
MANGSSYGRNSRSEDQPVLFVPPRRRATRILPAEGGGVTEPPRVRGRASSIPVTTIELPESRPSPVGLFGAHGHWLGPFLLCLGAVVLGLLVMLSAAIYERGAHLDLVTVPGQVYPVQIGGSFDAFNTWETSTGPLPPKQSIPSHPGPYSVLGKPTITADFINKVLAAYHSPAAGKGQALYDYGVQYGIDPVYALAFFMHESTFGTQGVARETKSLGNIRCIPTRPCTSPDGHGFAVMYSWEDGFLQWYKLIRNLYVAQWGLVTIEQIIPKYAPAADHNDEQAYIQAVEHAVDTWRAGSIYVT